MDRAQSSQALRCFSCPHSRSNRKAQSGPKVKPARSRGSLDGCAAGCCGREVGRPASVGRRRKGCVDPFLPRWRRRRVLEVMHLEAHASPIVGSDLLRPCFRKATRRAGNRGDPGGICGIPRTADRGDPGRAGRSAWVAWPCGQPWLWPTKHEASHLRDFVRRPPTSILRTRRGNHPGA